MTTTSAFRLGPGLLCALLLGTVSNPAPAAETIEIAVPEHVAITSIALPVLQRAYEKIGITLKTRLVPMRRSLQSASQGEVDGDLMRTVQALEQFPQLIAVRPALMQAFYFAYKLGTCPRRIGLAELRTRQVAYFRGTRAIELALPAQALRPASTHWDAIRNLQLGLSDYLLGEELETDTLLLRQNIRAVCKVTEPVLRLELVHALNRRHAGLVPRLERALTEMAEQGETARIRAVESQRLRDTLMAAPLPASMQ